MPVVPPIQSGFDRLPTSGVSLLNQSNVAVNANASSFGATGFRTTPDDFGAAEARALGSIGRGIQDFAFGVSDAVVAGLTEAERIKRKQEELQARDASARFKFEIDELTNQFKQKRGRDALRINEVAEEEFQRIYNDVSSGIESEGARVLFDRDAIVERRSMTLALGSHEAQETTAYEQELADSEVTTFENSAIENRSFYNAATGENEINFGTIEDYIGRSIGAIRSSPEGRTSPEEVTRNKMRDSLDRANSGILNGFISEGELGLAEEYLETLGSNDLRPDSRQKFEAQMRAYEVERTADTLANALLYPVDAEGNSLPNRVDQLGDVLSAVENIEDEAVKTATRQQVQTLVQIESQKRADAADAFNVTMHENVDNVVESVANGSDPVEAIESLQAMRIQVQADNKLSASQKAMGESAIEQGLSRLGSSGLVPVGQEGFAEDVADAEIDLRRAQAYSAVLELLDAVEPSNGTLRFKQIYDFYDGDESAIRSLSRYFGIALDPELSVEEQKAVFQNQEVRINEAQAISMYGVLARSYGSFASAEDIERIRTRSDRQKGVPRQEVENALQDYLGTQLSLMLDRGAKPVEINQEVSKYKELVIDYVAGLQDKGSTVVRDEVKRIMGFLTMPLNDGSTVGERLRHTGIQSASTVILELSGDLDIDGSSGDLFPDLSGFSRGDVEDAASDPANRFSERAKEALSRFDEAAEQIPNVSFTEANLSRLMVIDFIEKNLAGRLEIEVDPIKDAIESVEPVNSKVTEDSRVFNSFIPLP